MRTDDVKVGMKVRIKDHWVSRSYNHAGKMDHWLGQTMTVAYINTLNDDVKMIEDADENDGRGWYWYAEDFDPVIETETKSISLDDVRDAISRLSNDGLHRLVIQLEYHRRIESLQEITKRIRNYVATFGSFWLENIVDADGRVSFRDITDAIGYEISHLERSVGE